MDRQLNPRPSREQPISIPRVAWKACVLTDDFIHSGIDAAARKAEGRFNISRRSLAYGSMAAGTIATGAILSGKPLWTVAFAAIGSITFLVYSRFMEKAMAAKTAASACAESLEAAFLKLARLPALAWGAYKVAASIDGGERTDAAAGAYFIGIAVAAYLAASGTGALKKVIESLQERLSQAVGSHAAVPQEIGTRKKR
jgi:hypothetical protein